MGSPSRRRRALRPSLLALLLAFAIGCEEEPPPARTPEPQPEAAEAPQPLPAPSPWPAEVRSLEESVAAFESVERCVAAMRESVPVEVAELFNDLGYDDALGEVCRSLEAAAAGDPALCDELVSSTVARHCRTRVAALHEKPEACPAAVSRDGGRDPTCLAWATDDPSLCDGAPAGDRARCLAVATGEPERCDDPLGLRQGSCRALVERLDGIVDGNAPTERSAPELILEGGEAPIRLPEGAARTLERGVVATAAGCTHQVVVQVRPTIGGAREAVGLTLDLRLEGTGASLGSGSELAIGPVGTGYALRGEVALANASERRLGGPLVASFDATYLRDGTERRVTGRLRTFFRDLAPLPAHCGDD